MRIAFVYKINRVSIDYRSSFLSLIKEAIKKSDKFLYTKFYETENRDTKPFCFSVHLNPSKINNDIIEIVGNTRFYISNSEEIELGISEIELGIKLYNGLLGIKEYTFPDGQIIKQISVFQIREKNEKYFSKGEVCFKTMSTVIITDRSKKPLLHPDTKDLKGNKIEEISNINTNQNEFLTELNFSLKNIIKNNIQFISIDIKKEVIKHSIGDHLKISKEYIQLVGFKGRFVLKGNPSDLYKIYQLGIGFRRNQGFGMLDVV